MVDIPPQKLLSSTGLVGDRIIHAGTGSEYSIVSEAEAVTLKEKGYATWDPLGFAILTMAVEVRADAGSFITSELIEYSLSKIEESFPELVELIRERFDTFKLTQILRYLLDENISVKDLLSILESLLGIEDSIRLDESKYLVFLSDSGTSNPCITSTSKKEKDLELADYSEYIRTSLSKYISNKYARGSQFLSVYITDRQMEQTLRTIDIEPLKEDQHKNLISTIFKEFEKSGVGQNNSQIILTSPDIRRTLRNLISKEFPQAAALSYREVTPDLHLLRAGIIKWN
jgi:flagellar biosynthesis protein FlhA